MKLIILLASIIFTFNFNIRGQVRIIQERIISEDLEQLPKVSIQTINNLLIGETDINGNFKINIPQNNKNILLSFIGMEYTNIELKKECNTIEVVMMYDVIYDFMTTRRINRLRLKRFRKLPKIHQTAYDKGIFQIKKQCFTQIFFAIKPSLGKIKKK